ncbi:hypothetical protein LMOSLCC2482_p0017 (plasmid) [Listeria monocytogenes serotype 7 str. SLCC2482]|nr:hypothetical protein LMOSLCC2482_p0017 [Listeria monocytogenes serotype 7 str. SLCC2482]CBV37125.1 hypothetical protein LMOSLCC2372_p0017 [Listeria monocytogenes SLCC2372]
MIIKTIVSRKVATTIVKKALTKKAIKGTKNSVATATIIK